MTRGAFLILTHIDNDGVYCEASKIARATKSLGDTWLLFQGEPKNVSIPLIKNYQLPIHYCSSIELKELGFKMIAETIVPGSAPFSLIHFARANPDYDYYWIIEFDVRFRGFWKTFFQSFHETHYDFLASHIHTYHEEQHWYFWQLEHHLESIPLEDRIRCFHPIYRFSKKALQFIDTKLSEGWKGHSEVLIPTLLHLNDFLIGDFGGNGSFRTQRSKNFYIGTPPTPIGRLDEGTLRWRPGFKRAGFRWNKIYHPVKPVL